MVDNNTSIKRIIKILYSLLMVIAALIGILSYFNKDIVELEVEAINKTQLTKIANIDGLTVEFLYKDSVVKNLWQIIYSIKNVGSKTIITKGDSKNILEENLSISFNDSVKVLSVDTVIGNFPITTIIDLKNNVINLDFKQWKKSEYTYIVAIVESFGETEPSIFIDSRDIVDAKVTFLEHKPVERNKKIIEYFRPGIFTDFLKWAAVFFIVSPYVMLNITDIRDFRKKSNISKIDKINLILDILRTIIGVSLPLLWFF